MKITVRQKNPPRGRIYPVCPKAHIFLELLNSAVWQGRATFWPDELEIIKKLGFEVEVLGAE